MDTPPAVNQLCLDGAARDTADTSHCFFFRGMVKKRAYVLLLPFCRIRRIPKNIRYYCLIHYDC